MVLASATEMRGWIRLKLERPLSSSTAISPSRIACDAFDEVRQNAQLGILLFAALLVREKMRSWLSSMKQSARTPSHFTS